MTLETLVEKYKERDQKLLKGYTQLAKTLHLDKGTRKYWVGIGLYTLFNATSYPLFTNLFGHDWGRVATLGISSLDGVYNFLGITGDVKEEKENSALSIIDYSAHVCKTYNSHARLPLFAVGIGCLGAYMLSLISDSKGDAEILGTGLGFLSLSSSMYLKEFDPKMLQGQEEQVPESV